MEGGEGREREGRKGQGENRGREGKRGERSSCTDMQIRTSRKCLLYSYCSKHLASCWK